MTRKRTTNPLPERNDPFAPGVYLTDGTALFNIVGELPHEPSLRLVEDCATLEILMVHVDGLRAHGVRRVEAIDSCVAAHDADSPDVMSAQNAVPARAHR